MAAVGTAHLVTTAAAAGAKGGLEGPAEVADAAKEVGAAVEGTV